MIKEGAQPEEASREILEHKPELFEETIKGFIESHRAIENSGSNALILKFLKNELPPEILESLASDPEDNAEGSLSVKALKIFSAGAAEREFEFLQEARRIVSEKHEGEHIPLAKIPKASSFHEITVSKDFEEFLNSKGASITDGKVGLIMMDFIEGADLSSVLHKELLKRIPADQDIYSYDETQNPTFKDVMRALEKTDFVLPESIVTQIRNTIDLLHKHGLYHNDLHLRNVILKHEDLEKDPQAYMIDFATASHGKKTFRDTNMKILPDGQIIQSLTPLTKSKEEKEREIQEQSLKEWDDRIALTESNSRLQDQYASIKSLFDKNDPADLEKQFLLASSKDSDLQNFLAALIKLSREGSEYVDPVLDFIYDQEKAKGRTPFFFAQLRKAQEAID